MTPFEPFERSHSVTPNIPLARFGIGEVVRHKLFDFRGVIFDVDPEFANSEEWYDSIPEALRPSKEQPFYHLLAENSETAYIAYVSQQNLVPDETDEPIDHPAVGTMFERVEGGGYRLRDQLRQ
jgi:heat shock protein HspQ